MYTSLYRRTLYAIVIDDNGKYSNLMKNKFSRFSIILLILFFAFSANAQTIEEKFDFSRASYEQNDITNTVKYAEDIIQFMEAENIKDSTYVQYIKLFRYCYNQLGDLNAEIKSNTLLLGYYRENNSMSTLSGISVLDALSENYRNVGDLQQYEIILIEKLKTEKVVFKSDKTPNSLNSHISLALYFDQFQTIDKALNHYSSALEILTTHQIDYPLGYSLVYNGLSNISYQLSNYTQAIDYRTAKIQITEATVGKKSEGYIMDVASLCNIYMELGKYQTALELQTESESVCRSLLGENNNLYIGLLNSRGSLCRRMGQYNDALETYKEALDIIQNVPNPDYISKSNLLQNIANIYGRLDEHKLKNEALVECLQLRKIHLGTDHPEYAKCLGSLGNSYLLMGDLVSAEKYFLQEKNIYANTIGKEHDLYANSLLHLAFLNHHYNDYNEEMRLEKEARTILQNKFGNNHPRYASANLHVGLTYGTLGDYKAALLHYQSSLKIQHKAIGTAHPDYANTLSYIASIYNKYGDYESSQNYRKQAIEINKSIYGTEHSSYARSLQSLGYLAINRGEYDAAILLFMQASELLQIILGDSNPDYAESIAEIGYAYVQKKDYSAAKTILNKALNLQKKILGDNHPSYANTINDIGILHMKEGDYDSSNKCLNKSLTIQKNNFGTQHPNYAQVLNNLGELNIKMNNYAAADTMLSTAYEIQENHFDKNYLILTNEQMLLYKNKVRENSIKYLEYSNFRASNNPNITISSLESFMNQKNLVSNHAIKLKRKIFASGDSLLIDLYKLWRKRKVQLAMHYELNLEEKESYEITIENEEKLVDSLEQQLTLKSDYLLQIKDKASIDVIKESLEEDEAYIEIVQVPHYSFSQSEWTDSTQYYVYIITSNESKGQQEEYGNIKLTNGNFMDNKGLASYNSFTSGRNKDVYDVQSYSLFWSEIAERLNEFEVKVAYVSIDGVFNEINIKTLYNPKTKKYVSEELDIDIVSSARNFIQEKNTNQPPATELTASVYGYPNYNSNADTINDTNPLAFSRELNQFWIDSLSRGSIAQPLPGTKKEVENISKMLSNVGWSVSTYIQNSATESQLKQVTSPTLLHIATHGYFFENIPQDKTKDIQFMGINYSAAVQNPMLRSGLLFAGANNALGGNPTNGENGLLNAYEVSLLDLSETQLVVLSACESGLGEVINGEGVYGLPLAVKAAGAENIIMSLWKVDDRVTQEFMTTFYSTWLSGKTIREAFIQTQLTIKEKYPQPYYWGAFVLVGNS